jgi:hypothetical protein
VYAWQPFRSIFWMLAAFASLAAAAFLVKAAIDMEISKLIPAV